MKVYPIITGLITISLIGIIFIQYSWLKNMTAIRKEQVADKVDRVEFEVVEALLDTMSGSTTSIPLEVVPENDQEGVLNMLGTKTLKEIYSEQEIKKLFVDAFSAQGLKGVAFEFAVISESNKLDYEIISPGFEKYAQLVKIDSANYLLESWPLVSYPNEAKSVNMQADQRLVFIYDLRSAISKSLNVMFIASLALIIILFFGVVYLLYLLRKSQYKSLK